MISVIACRQSGNDPLVAELDKKINHAGQYEQAKIMRLRSMKALLKNQGNSNDQTYQLNNQLYFE